MKTVFEVMARTSNANGSFDNLIATAVTSEEAETIRSREEQEWLEFWGQRGDSPQNDVFFYVESVEYDLYGNRTVVG